MGRAEYNGEVISHDPEALPTTLAASRAVVSGAGFGALQDGGYIAAAKALVGAVVPDVPERVATAQRRRQWLAAQAEKRQ